MLALAREEGVELTTDELDAISGGGDWLKREPIMRRFGYRRVYTEPAFDLDADFDKESARLLGLDREGAK